MTRNPDCVPGYWAQAEAGLASLREPFREYAAQGSGWIEDFDEFARLIRVRERGDIVTGAGRRGWGVVGLHC